jgi:hypothetical protein
MHWPLAPSAIILIKRLAMPRPTFTLIINPAFEQQPKRQQPNYLSYNRLYVLAIKKRWHMLQHALQQRVKFLLDLWRQAWEAQLNELFLAKIDTERNCIDFLLEKIAGGCLNYTCICTSIARLHQQFDAHTKQIIKAIERRKHMGYA